MTSGHEDTLLNHQQVIDLKDVFLTLTHFYLYHLMKLADIVKLKDGENH